MNNKKYEIDLGFVITKAPYESFLASNMLELAEKSLKDGKSIGIFLISDGIWLAKKNITRKPGKLLQSIIKRGAIVTVSKDNLESAGIDQSELFRDIIISDKPYIDLVTQVMEKWKRVITI
jgi:sulfur relay (sulfurtransferase) complex TusBCD TusD component (DsrE family)